MCARMYNVCAKGISDNSLTASDKPAIKEVVNQADLNSTSPPSPPGQRHFPRGHRYSSWFFSSLSPMFVCFCNVVVAYLHGSSSQTSMSWEQPRMPVTCVDSQVLQPGGLNWVCSGSENGEPASAGEPEAEADRFCCQASLSSQALHSQGGSSFTCSRCSLYSLSQRTSMRQPPKSEAVLDYNLHEGQDFASLAQCCIPRAESRVDGQWLFIKWINWVKEY